MDGSAGSRWPGRWMLIYAFITSKRLHSKLKRTKDNVVFFFIKNNANYEVKETVAVIHYPVVISSTGSHGPLNHFTTF